MIFLAGSEKLYFLRRNDLKSTIWITEGTFELPFMNRLIMLSRGALYEHIFCLPLLYPIYDLLYENLDAGQPEVVQRGSPW